MSNKFTYNERVPTQGCDGSAYNSLSTYSFDEGLPYCMSNRFGETRSVKDIMYYNTFVLNKPLPQLSKFKNQPIQQKDPLSG